jgi:autoinducer 2-degrading protein
MRPMFHIWLAVGLLPAGFIRPASADESPIYVATYVEVMAPSVAAAVSMLGQEAAATRKDDGNRLTQLLREVGKDNRFVVRAIWKDQQTFEAHGRSEHTRRSREQLAAMQISPPDERVHTVLSIGAAKASQPSAAVHVVTHVDVPPPSKDAVIALLRQLVDDSVEEPANLAFEVVQQTSRPNHFTVIETWTDRASLDAHEMAAHTRRFRDKLGPMLGAPYDDRIYRPID